MERDQQDDGQSEDRDIIDLNDDANEGDNFENLKRRIVEDIPDTYATPFDRLINHISQSAVSIASELTREGKRFVASIKSSPKVLAIGYTGTGKTTLIEKVLRASLVNPEKHEVKSTVQQKDHPLKVKTTDMVVVDTPGNEGFYDELDKTIEAFIEMGDPIGIIHVVSYGFNESHSRGAVAPTTAPLIGTNVNDDFLSFQRGKDIEHLKKCLSNTAFLGNVRWILTVVNKRELWDDRVEAVDAYYGEDGPYRQLINDYLPDRPHQVVHACGELAKIKASDPSWASFFGCRLPVQPDLHNTLTTKNDEMLGRIAENVVRTNQEGESDE